MPTLIQLTVRSLSCVAISLYHSYELLPISCMNSLRKMSSLNFCLQDSGVFKKQEFNVSEQKLLKVGFQLSSLILFTVIFSVEILWMKIGCCLSRESPLSPD